MGKAVADSEYISDQIEIFQACLLVPVSYRQLNVIWVISPTSIKGGGCGRKSNIPITLVAVIRQDQQEGASV